MSRSWRIAGSLLFLLFVLSVFLRPVLSNPFILTLFEDGGSDWQTTLVVLLGLVPLTLVLAARLTDHLRDHDPSSSAATRPERRVDQAAAGSEFDLDAPGAEDGVTCDDAFEQEPPEASLEAHWAHLEEALDDEAVDPAAMETLRSETDDGALPARCPGEHCDAAWTERTIFGVGTDQYELLPGEETVVCLECEREFSLAAVRG